MTELACCPTCEPGTELDEDAAGWWCPAGEHHVSATALTAAEEVHDGV